MKFTKMHGAGNDYIYVEGFSQPVPTDPPELSRKISDRHFGIGGDGLVLILPPETGSADARMRMFNADGSEAQMCGNAIRCVAKYVYDHDLVKKDKLVIETLRGPLSLELTEENGKIAWVRVNMAAPILEAAKIPTTLPGTPPKEVPITAGGKTFPVTCVSMGNPHAVAFVEEITDEWVLGVGPKVERHEAFPERINAEFVQVLSRTEVNMRVWERGSGETLACGTGACAVAVAGVLTGRTERKITVHLTGGDLKLEWNEADNNVYMTGPATEVFSGEISL